jgi:hypothetical protein
MNDPFDTPYDPDRPTHLDRQLDAQLETLNPSAPITIRGFRPFTLLLHRGFKSISYAAETRPQDGAMYWITEDHARRIGAALAGHLQAFTLCLTTFEDDGACALAEALSSDLRIDEVTFSHKTADEVTHREARGFARLVTQVQARKGHLWAGGFAPGSLDVLLQELSKLDNTTLQDLDVCDLSLSEPEDRILDPGLEAFTRKNRDQNKTH